MSSSESSKLQQAIEQLAQSIGDFGLQKLVLSQRKEDSSEIHRVEFRPVQLKTGRAYQVTSFSRTQAFHRNLSAADAVKEAVRLATDDFFGFRMTLRTEVIEVQSVRKGGVRLRKQARADVESSAGERVPCDAAIPLAHNQVKNYLIPDQTPCPFLIETGIMSKDGHVKASHMKKFRQINRFLEFINDIAASLPDDRPIRIVDFGCGKSYLTFATHYLFTEILRRNCDITGLDLRSDVVQTCRQIQSRLGLRHLRFETGNISEYQTPDVIDLVISLHACDTATDYAIFQAIQWNATAILAVPCCQHELNKALPADGFLPITSYGLTKERFAALLTDSLRASILSRVGYQTQLLEFIELEHTPKNILIRAINKNPSRENVKALWKSKLAPGSSTDVLSGCAGPLTLERLLDEYVRS